MGQIWLRLMGGCRFIGVSQAYRFTVIFVLNVIIVHSVKPVT